MHVAVGLMMVGFTSMQVVEKWPSKHSDVDKELAVKNLIHEAGFWISRLVAEVALCLY